MSSSDRAKKVRESLKSFDLEHTLSDDVNHIKIENCIGFAKVPIGIAGPLRIHGPNTDSTFLAPLATYEPTVVASCSRGCKAFGAEGVQFEVLSEGMSRAPVFVFDSPGAAVRFAREFPSMVDEFGAWASLTGRFVRLQQAKPHIIGSHVHVFCHYHCGDAVGQNMVTKASKYACDMLRETYGDRLGIKDFFVEGQMSSDKKPSWGSVKTARGVEVMAWGTITDERSQKVFGCTSYRLYHFYTTSKEGGVRNGMFGSNYNTANIMAALFISTGQDIASTGESSWTHLSMNYNHETRDLRVSLYIPSLPVGTVGGGTGYATQKEALRLLQCDGPGLKGRLAGVIASFSMALDVSTAAAIANDTFTASHMTLARGERQSKL